MNISVRQMISQFGCSLLCGNLDIECSSFSIDTRELKKKDCFIALRGEKTDGSVFYQEAFEKGVKVVILPKTSENMVTKKMGTILLVEDTMKLFISLAEYRRKSYSNPVIAVTGSVGKTSTKEFIYSVLKEKYTVLKSEKNYNNILGLCLTLLNLKEEEILLVELGMNHLGEISTLSKLVKPDIAIITNIGTAHIGNLGSRENILKAKLEILDGMNEQGILFLNYDDSYLRKVKYDRIVPFSINQESLYQAKDILVKENGLSFTLDDIYFIPVFQNTYVYNALVAILLGKHFSLSKEEIQRGLSAYQLPSGRGNIVLSNSDICIIDDTYNASLESILSSVDVLEKQLGRRILVLGDILEIGKHKEEIYTKIGKKIANKKIDILITIGSNRKMSSYFEKERYHFTTIQEAKEFLKTYLREKDVILLKASHGANFKELVTFIENM